MLMMKSFRWIRLFLTFLMKLKTDDIGLGMLFEGSDNGLQGFGRVIEIVVAEQREWGRGQRQCVIAIFAEASVVNDMQIDIFALQESLQFCTGSFELIALRHLTRNKISHAFHLRTFASSQAFKALQSVAANQKL